MTHKGHYFYMSYYPTNGYGERISIG